MVKRVTKKLKKSVTYFGKNKAKKNKNPGTKENSQVKMRSSAMNDILESKRMNHARARSRSILKRDTSQSSENSSSSSNSSFIESVNPLPKPLLNLKKSKFSKNFKKLTSLKDKAIDGTQSKKLGEMTESLKVINTHELEERKSDLIQKRITKLNQKEKQHEYKYLFDYHSPSSFTENFRICESELEVSNLKYLMRKKMSNTEDPRELKRIKSSMGIKESRKIQHLKDKLGDAYGPLRFYINNREMPCIPVTRCLGCFSGIEAGLMSTPSNKDLELGASSVCIFIAGYELWETLGTQTVVNSISEGLSRNRLEEANRDLYKIFRYEQRKLKRDKKFHHQGFDCAFIVL